MTSNLEEGPGDPPAFYPDARAHACGRAFMASAWSAGSPHADVLSVAGVVIRATGLPHVVSVGDGPQGMMANSDTLRHLASVLLGVAEHLDTRSSESEHPSVLEQHRGALRSAEAQHRYNVAMQASLTGGAAVGGRRNG